MPAESSAVQVRRTATVWDHSILLRGIAAGLVGACAVAAFFLLIDWAEGQPLRTPALLGSRLLLTAPGDAGGGDQRMLELTYTVVHAGAFIAIGAIAAFLAADLEATRSWRWIALVASALFAAMSVLLLSFSALFDPALIDALGWFRTALGNLLAAAAMTPIILGAHTDPETTP